MSEEYENPEGGEQEYGGDGPNLRYDDFVGRIVQDPNEPPSVTLLSGYLGASSEEGHVRLYLDEELTRYVEIPEKAVRHTQELPPEQSPLGGSLLWIDRDAEVLHGAAGSERSRATFLEGQIAHDYLSGGITTQTRECVGPPPTAVGPSCGPSQFRPCIPQTLLPGCRTRTGIFCTRLGPGCGLTSFDPVCTIAGQHCHTALPHQCQSIYNICVTQNQSYCVASGFYGCNPPIDFTIYEQPGVQQQFGQQVAFAGGGFGGGGFDPGGQVFERGAVAALQPTLSRTCPTQFGCFISHIIRCPTVKEPRCYASALVLCRDTRAGCQFESAACGVDPAGGFDPAGGLAQGFEAQPYARHPTQNPACDTWTPGCGNAPTLTASCKGTDTGFVGGGGGGGGYGAAAAIPPTLYCPSQFIACPTRFNCPSRYTPCQSQLVRCPSALDACPTRYNCPTLPNGCPGYTRFGACETYGPCPSAVDACPSRLGCYETAACGASIACNPGGGGGFDPGGFGGGGFGGGF
ncbi:MAG: hypothetical protein JOZ02_04200 [Acidobacteria bacterium]|nr:hypothetical protein [Acidobacteriota bacterium]